VCGVDELGRIVQPGTGCLGIWPQVREARTLDPDDFTDAQAIAAVERFTRGNFRLLERLFPVTDDVVEAAASILVIGN
jgi:hypothetical protein